MHACIHTFIHTHVCARASVCVWCVLWSVCVCQVLSPYERALDASRQDHAIGLCHPEPQPDRHGVLADAAFNVIARLDAGGSICASEVPVWFGCEWLMDDGEGGLRACVPMSGDQSRSEVRLDMPWSEGEDNVHGCVRGLVVNMGEVGVGNWRECRGLPRSGEKVVLCDRRECPCDFPHPADPGTLYPIPARDGVIGGVPFRTSSCHRTCSGCGVTWVTRMSRAKHMWFCGGCHAPTPFLKSGAGEPDDVTRLLGVLGDVCPVYCNQACQVSHWDREHKGVCLRFDQWLHAGVVERFCLATSANEGDDLPVTEYGVPHGGGTIPFLVPASRLQPGLSSGWGYA